MKSLWWANKINKDYAYELGFFSMVKKFKNGIIFFNSDLDLSYRGDHSPQFELRLIILNCMLIELSIYNVHHKD